MMMAEDSGELPLALSVLAASTGDPAVALIGDHHIGGALDFDAVVTFARRSEVVTFDHEVVNLEALEKLVSEGLIVAPSPDALRYATDKAFQRDEFARRGLPIPEFVVLRTLDHEALRDFCSRHPVVVVKAARGGYDGRGVSVVHGDPTDLVSELLPHTPVVLEEYLDLSSELAVSVVTARDGTRVIYPPVDTVQRDGMCEQVNVPSLLQPEEIATATQLASEVADVVGAVGVLAVEMFVTSRGIVINEVATRPHNSGHWSIEGATTSQFENHMRAVAGLELGGVELRAPLITMINVVGGVNEPEWADLEAVDGTHLHHYRKANRPGRKLGHVTIVSTTASEHSERVRAVRQILGI